MVVEYNVTRITRNVTINIYFLEEAKNMNLLYLIPDILEILKTEKQFVFKSFVASEFLIVRYFHISHFLYSNF